MMASGYILSLTVGIACLLLWLILLFVKHSDRRQGEIEVMVHTGSGGGESGLPVELRPGELKRNLEFYSGNASALQKYVQGLRDRFEMDVGLKVMAKAIQEVNTRKELVDAAYEALRSQGRLQRVGDEERLEEMKLQTGMLEQQQRQEQLRQEITETQELGNVELEYKQRKLRKDIADLDKEKAATRPTPRKPSVREKVGREARGEALVQEKLREWRVQHPPAEGPSCCDSEALWREEWMKKPRDVHLSVFEQYETYEQRLRDAVG